jgi:lipopolysaccharide export system protein LptA
MWTGFIYLMNELFKQHNWGKTGMLTALLLFTLPATVWADEAVEKIFINADQMQMNIGSGKSVYTGNVKITQGKLVLLGHKVTLERNLKLNNKEIERLTVIGKPARYNHVTEAGEAIEAQSEHMVYIASQNKLVMTVNAHLQQPDLILSSQKIIYNTQKQIVIAGGNDDQNATGTEVKQTQRVNITLTPKEAPADK